MIQPPYHQNDEDDVLASSPADNLDTLRKKNSSRRVDSEPLAELSLPAFLEQNQQTHEPGFMDYSFMADMEEPEESMSVYDEEKPGQLISPAQEPEWLTSLSPGDKMNGQDLSKAVGERFGFKINTLVISIAMLPVLAVGTATYFFGKQAIDAQIHQLEQVQPNNLDRSTQSERNRLEQLLAILLMGSGCTALLSGVLATLWANRLLKAAMAEAKTDVEQQTQNDRGRRSQVLAVAATRMRASPETNNILTTTVDAVRDIIPCDRVVVYRFDHNLHLSVVAESVAQGCAATLGNVVNAPNFIAKPVETSDNDVQVIENIYEAGLSTSDIAFFDALGIKALMRVPLFVNGHPYGFLVAQECSFPVPRVWSQSEKEVMAQLSLQVSSALDGAQLLSDHAALQAQLDRETQWKGFFDDATRLLHDSFQQEDILKAAVEESRRVLAADRVVVYSVDQQTRGVIIAESVAPQFPRAMGKTIEDPCFEARYIEMYGNGRVRAIPNIYEAGMTPCYIEQLEKLSVKANLVVPVLHDGQLLGLLVAHQCSEPRVWQDLEIRWFTQIAVQVGLALDNAKFKQSAETIAQMLHQDKAEIHQQIAAILQESQASFGDLLSTETLPNLKGVAAVAEQLQEAADSSRSIVAKAQKAELQLHDVSLVMQESRDHVNQTVDLMAEIQEIVTGSTFRLKNLCQSAQKISQVVTQINDLAVEMRHQAINASISSGQFKDKDQGAIVALAEAVLSFTEQLKAATTDIKPMVMAIETDISSVGDAMEVGAEHTIVGTELIKETRHKLNQLSSVNSNLSSLISKMVEVGPIQSHTLTHASQTMQGVVNLTTVTLGKSTELSELFNKLEATMQEL
jgi:methyl-accepting chemotaxis protein PixJ